MSDEKPVTNVDESMPEQTVSVNAPIGATQDYQNAALKLAATASSSGVQVRGYRILSVLGRGGMGIVYKAIQEKANRPVALKMILAGAHADQHDQTRFRVEAEAAARLSHPNIVQLYEVGDTPDGFPYFSLEFVSGGTLAERLKQGPLRPNEAAPLVEMLARAMQYAHERGIIHRDLKPLNILLAGEANESSDNRETMIKAPVTQTLNRPDPNKPHSSATLTYTPKPSTPKISDFGLAKQLDSDDGLTRTGAIMGSPNYMAPEQAFGQSKNVGPAADIYALGAILYECLTGRPPFKGATIADTLEQVRTMEPITLRAFAKEIPRDLETICLHCLHKDPQRRYGSAEALADDLRRYYEGKPITVRPVGNAERVIRWCRRNPGWAAMIGVAAFSLVGVAAISIYAAVEVSAQNVVIKKERKEAEEARDDADKKKKLAEDAKKLADEKTELAKARLDQSLQAVGLFATDARMYCEDAMVPGPSRTRLYGVLIKQLEKQAAQGAGEATIDGLRNKAFLYQTLCAVTLDFDEFGESKKWFDKGLATVDQWEKLRPGDVTALSFRATLLNLRANSLKFERKLDDARRLHADSLEIRRKLVGNPDVDLPSKMEAISKLADSLDSLEQFEESIPLREEICSVFAKEDAIHQASRQGKLYAEARERSFPYREALCWTYQKAGFQANDYATRKKFLTQADTMSSELLNERRTSRNILLRWVVATKMLGELEYNHGVLAEKAGKKDDAEKYFATATEQYQKLNELSKRLATSSEMIDGLRDYARSFYTLGLAEKRQGNPTKARAHFETSRVIRAQTFYDYGASSRSSHLLLDLFFSQLALGELASTMDRAENMSWTFQAEPDASYRLACLYALAVDTIEESRGPNPLTDLQKRLQNRYRAAAIQCLHLAHDGGFTDFFQSNIDSDLGALRDDPAMKEFEATHQYRLGIAKKKHGDAKSARAHFEKSQELARQFMKALPNDARFRHAKLASLSTRVQLGQYAEAIEEADELAPKVRSSGALLFLLARVYSLASAATSDPKLQEHYRTEALTALHLVSTFTKGDALMEARLVSEDDLDPIRDDPRFKKELESAKKRTK